MKLIVGLGNPGLRYKKTRHNIGFMFVDELIKQNKEKFSLNKPLKSEIATIMINNEKVLVIKPQTYMNLSGEAVNLVSKYYHIEVNDILFQPEEKQHVFARAIDFAPFDGRQIKLGHFLARGHPLAIDPPHLEAECHRLTISARSAELGTVAGTGGQVGIAAGIDKDRSLDRHQAALGVGDDVADAAIAGNGVHKGVVIEQLHPGFQTEILRCQGCMFLVDIQLDILEGFAFERIVARLAGRQILVHRGNPVGIDGMVQRTFERVVHHEGVNLARNSHATELTVAFDQQNFRPLTCCHHGRPEPARAAPYNNNIRLGDDRNLTTIVDRFAFHDASL